MKKPIFPIILAAILASQAAGAATGTQQTGATVQKPIKGSREAALQVVTTYLQGAYKAPGEVTSRSAILQDSAQEITLHVGFRNLACNMQLRRHDTANDLGWVVKVQRCSEELTGRSEV